MAGVASLGMYDSPALHEANDALWRQIAARLTEHGLADVPDTLDRSRALDDIWSDPGLLLAQTCGYPLVTQYRGRLRYLATPRYAAPGCQGTNYRSRIIVRVDDPARHLADLRGRRVAINGWHSNSGMNMLRAAVAPLAQGAPFFAEAIETGAHAASLRAVAEDDADVAAIDAVSFVHLAREDPNLAARVRTIGWTAPSPGLPLVTAITTPPATVRLLRQVLDAVMQAPEARPALNALLIAGSERLPPRAYDTLLRAEQAATRLGYPVLAGPLVKTAS